jgi:hypothetical protein
VGPASHVTGHHVVKHNRTTGQKASKPATKVTKVKPITELQPKTRPVPYIYMPAGTPSVTPYVDPNGCVDSGTDCTDQELCEYWGMNCDSLPTAGQSDPAGTDSSTSTDPTAGYSNACQSPQEAFRPSVGGSRDAPADHSLPIATARISSRP